MSAEPHASNLDDDRPSLTCIVLQRRDAVRVYPIGVLDTATVPVLERQLQEVREAGFGGLAGVARSRNGALPAPRPINVVGDVAITHAFSHAVSRRGDGKGASPQPLSPKAAGAALEQRVDKVAGEASATRERAALTVEEGLAGVDAIFADLEAVVEIYKAAYKTFEDTLRRADAQAKGSEMIKDFVLGLAVSAAVGASLGTALAGFAAVGAAQNAFQLNRLNVVSWLGKQAVKDPIARGAGAVERSRAFLAKADPNLRRIEAYQKLSELLGALAKLGLAINDEARVADWCLGVKADARELATSGHGKITPAELEHRVLTLEEAGKAQSGLRDQVVLVAARLSDAARAAGFARKAADPTRMERQLWIHWMASLPPGDAQLLDEDPIEERLADLGIEGQSDRQATNRSMIGWYVGDWHSKADSKAGVARAKPYSDALRAVGIVGVLHDAEVKGVTVGVEFDWRGEPRKPSRDKAYTVGRIDLGGTPGDPARPWARKDGWDVMVGGEAEDGDNVRVTGVRGDDRPDVTPTLLGQLLTDEKRGVPPPSFPSVRQNDF